MLAAFFTARPAALPRFCSVSPFLTRSNYQVLSRFGLFVFGVLVVSLSILFFFCLWSFVFFDGPYFLSQVSNFQPLYLLLPVFFVFF